VNNDQQQLYHFCVRITPFGTYFMNLSVFQARGYIGKFLP